MHTRLPKVGRKLFCNNSGLNLNGGMDERRYGPKMFPLPDGVVRGCAHRALGTKNYITTMRPKIRFVSLTGWLLPAALAGIYFGRWIKEIVVPTLKGGNFEQLYDLHQVSYLHATMWYVGIAFVWLAL